LEDSSMASFAVTAGSLSGDCSPSPAAGSGIDTRDVCEVISEFKLVDVPSVVIEEESADVVRDEAGAKPDPVVQPVIVTAVPKRATAAARSVPKFGDDSFA
jgi:hypothetical protein